MTLNEIVKRRRAWGWYVMLSRCIAQHAEQDQAETQDQHQADLAVVK